MCFNSFAGFIRLHYIKPDILPGASGVFHKHQIMTNNTEFSIDGETISKIGLRLSDKPINATIAPDARVFDYPGLRDVFIMESDLYGNKMPKNSCFLVFIGQHGLIGKHLKIEMLKTASLQDIRDMVDNHNEG